VGTTSIDTIASTSTNTERCRLFNLRQKEKSVRQEGLLVQQEDQDVPCRAGLRCCNGQRLLQADWLLLEGSL
jgi:hypothetical protein